MSQMGSRTNPAMLIEIAQKLMGSLALMTAAFWSALINRVPSVCSCKRIKGKCISSQMEICAHRLRVTRPAPTLHPPRWYRADSSSLSHSTALGCERGIPLVPIGVTCSPEIPPLHFFGDIELNCQKMSLEGHRLDFGVNKFFCILQVLTTSVKELSCTHSVHCCTELCFFYV